MAPSSSTYESSKIQLLESLSVFKVTKARNKFCCWAGVAVNIGPIKDENGWNGADFVLMFIAFGCTHC